MSWINFSIAKKALNTANEAITQVETVSTDIDAKFTENTVPSPTVTVPDSVNEGAVLAITITDFDPTATYTVSGTLGEFTYVSGNTATCQVKTVEEDTTGTVVVSATKAGMLQSEDTTMVVNIINVPIEADGILSNSDFATFADTNNGFEY